MRWKILTIALICFACKKTDTPPKVWEIHIDNLATDSTGKAWLTVVDTRSNTNVDSRMYMTGVYSNDYDIETLRFSFQTKGAADIILKHNGTEVANKRVLTASFNYP